MAVPMVVGRPLRVLVVDADRIPVIGKFLDDPAVFGASGLDLKEVIRSVRSLAVNISIPPSAAPCVAGGLFP